MRGEEVVKKIVVCVSILLFASVVIFSTTELYEQSFEAKSFGVYARGEGISHVFDNVFENGLSSEIFNITPEIFYSYNLGGEVLGEFFETDAQNFNLTAFAYRLGLVVEKTTQVGSIYNIYARSSMLPYRISGQNFNIQIAIDGERVKVASPIILGSF